MKKTLIMLYDLYNDGLYEDIINITTTQGNSIDSFEKAEQIIVDNYTSKVTNWSIVQEDNEVYLYADQELPCQNCPE
jgi:hypothetical protein